jgi:hypothetical protein
MDLPLINKYQLSASIGERAFQWRFSVELDNGERHELKIADAAEIPLLLDLLRKDPAVYFDANTHTLCTGWNDPGKTQQNG